MAERRMFAKTIIDSDAFLDMPLSAQSLYFHLSMRADDDGFVNNPKKIQRMIGASDDDLKILVAKSFIIPFDSGIVVIKHWKIHNYIRGDRLHPTKYIEERSALEVKENGAYTVSSDLCQSNVSQMSDSLDTEVRLGKVRLGKDSIGKDRVEEVSEEEDSIETVKSIVDYLNMVCGTNYRYQTANTKKHIRARLSEGFTYEDFQKVIDKKSAEWTGTTMEKFLRPDTLFGSKFESYLNQNIVKGKQGSNKSGGIDWDNV